MISRNWRVRYPGPEIMFIDVEWNICHPKKGDWLTIWCFICCFKASSSHRLIGIFVLLGWFPSFLLFIYHPIFSHSMEFPKLSFDFNLNKWRALKLAKFAKTSYVSIFLSFLNFCARPNILYEYFLSEVKYKFSWPTKCQNKGPGWPPAGLFNDF